MPISAMAIADCTTHLGTPSHSDIPLQLVGHFFLQHPLSPVVTGQPPVGVFTLSDLQHLPAISRKFCWNRMKTTSDVPGYFLIMIMVHGVDGCV